ncbi:MAG TPA: asparagine synthase-related protein [Lachnospiraceae bacterium]|nr:asparagine synthase-related protein [Lachnospiraceae bacterium]
MSAIWGRINKDKNIDEATVHGMNMSMSEYKLDRIDQIKQSNIYFACGHQYITNEAVTDISPIYDEVNNVYFTADCFLYNRSAIISQLTQLPDFHKIVKSETLASCGDALLAYYSFQLLGFSFVEILRGSFSFAIYEAVNRKLHLITDHLCKRYLAYYDCEDYVCYGSTYKPIKFCLGKNLELNRRFIINSYRDMSPMNFVESGTTAYQGIFHVDNATHITIHLDTQTIEKKSYWNPLSSVEKMHGKSDDEYKDFFLKTYEAITHAQLRARKQTGIMLSGGLDSSSVAAFAAPYLAKEGKKLYSYTSVPASQYDSTVGSWIIENESYLIEEQCKWHPNLYPHYITSDTENCMTCMERFQNEYDIPVKPSINNINIDMMGKAATDDGCSILLSGGNGNATVSYGSIGQYITLSIQKGHFCHAFQEMFVFCKRHKLSRKKYLLKWLKVIIQYLLTNPPEKAYYLQSEDIQKYHLEHVKMEAKKKFGDEYFAAERQKYNFMYMPMLYIQKGFYYTYQGLLQGYLQLDPTLTVEIIELCMSFPDECFVHNGIERRMIRDYMKDLIPFPIVDDKKGYGVQAADFAYRVNRDWDEIKDSVYDILKEPLLREYLNGQKLDELINTIQSHEYGLDKPTVWDATLIGSLGYFLRDYHSNKNNL